MSTKRLLWWRRRESKRRIGSPPGDQLLAAAPDLLAACVAAQEALEQEWLYQTGQFSRVATPPSNYPPQGSVHGSCMKVMQQLDAAITKAAGEEEA